MGTAHKSLTLLGEALCLWYCVNEHYLITEKGGQTLEASGLSLEAVEMRPPASHFPERLQGDSNPSRLIYGEGDGDVIPVQGRALLSAFPLPASQEQDREPGWTGKRSPS